MISGYLTKDRVSWMEKAKDLWLQIEDVNIILVTWQDANRYVYSTAVANTPIVARQITIFLYYLAELNGFKLKMNQKFLNNIHFIGHSLGAHIGGFVGQDLDGKMGRITALDPAGPSFDQMDRYHRLDKLDAKFVDVIHSNAGKIHYANAATSGVIKILDGLIYNVPLIGGKLEDTLSLSNYTNEGDTAWFGIEEDVGHIDYYANNGKVQPGCDDFTHICDHGRVNKIFLDVLNYELQLRSLTSARDYLKQHRLLAFKSEDYDRFNNGENLVKFCPKALNSRHSLLSLNKTIQSCSLPLDFITPVDELIEEFSRYQHIDFNDSSFRSSNRYYFKTLKESPFLGDHYLLKIKNDPARTYWSSRCSLRVQLLMPDQSVNEIELNKDSLVPLEVKEDSQLTSTAVVIPFVNYNTITARDSLNNFLLTTQSVNGKFNDLIYKIMPSMVEIKIERAKSTGMLEAIKNKFKNALLINKLTSSSLHKCQLAIESVEIQPLIDNDRGLIGIYCFERNCINRVGSSIVYNEQTLGYLFDGIKANPNVDVMFGKGPSSLYQLSSIAIGQLAE